MIPTARARRLALLLALAVAPACSDEPAGAFCSTEHVVDDPEDAPVSAPDAASGAARARDSSRAAAGSTP